MEKYKDLNKMYPVFRVDICFTSYAMHYVLVGAESKEDLLVHKHDIFTDTDLDYGTGSVDEITDVRVEEVKGLYTDNPYTQLDHYSYYE